MLVTLSMCYTANTNRSIFESTLCCVLFYFKMFQIQKASRITLSIIHISLIPSCLSKVPQYSPVEKNVFFPEAAKENTLVKYQQALHSLQWNSSFAPWLHRQTYPLWSQDKKKTNKSINNFKEGTCLATINWLFRCGNWRKSEQNMRKTRWVFFPISCVRLKKKEKAAISDRTKTTGDDVLGRRCSIPCSLTDFVRDRVMLLCIPTERTQVLKALMFVFQDENAWQTSLIYTKTVK